MVRYQRLHERVQDTTGSNFIEVRYGKIPKVAIL